MGNGIQVVQGFDDCGSTTILGTDQGWTGTPSSIQTGRIAGSAIRLDNTSANSQSWASDTRASIGIALKMSGGNPGSSTWLRLYEGGAAGTEHGRLGINSDGSLTVSRAGSIASSSTTGILTTGVWYYIEWDYYCANSGGYWTVKVNGTTVISGTGLDTRNGGASGALDTLRFTVAGSSSWDHDDFYVCTGTTGLLGDQRVITQVPTGAGTYSEWTASAGSGYQCVDEIPHTSDTDYISSATVGNRETFTFPALGVTGTVKAVALHRWSRKDDAGARNIAPMIRRSSTDYVGTTVAQSASYAGQQQIYETDPSTSAAWTVSGIDAGEYGVKDV